LFQKPDFSCENQIFNQGFKFIAGCDEAGRGSLAGPVVAAAVILNPEQIPDGLDDSKRLTKAAREAAFEQIMVMSTAVAFCSVNASEIDETNILKATLKAMAGAINALATPPDYALIDGNKIPPSLTIQALALVKGDQRCLSISAASIVAKVMRDRMMKQADAQWPVYGFADHAGYGTKKHMQAIKDYGAIRRLHRYSFAPIKHSHNT
jgi:ribonuclease HII